MKYLKYFENINLLRIPDWNNNVISDLKDICLELSDKGFTIDISHGSISSYVTIYKPNKYITTVNGNNLPSSHNGNYKEFDTNEISETLERIEEYLGNKWVDTSLSRSGALEGDDVKGKVIIAEVEFKLSNKNPYFNIKPFNESNGMRDTKGLASDIEDTLIEFYDSGLMVNVTIMNTDPDETDEIQVYISHHSYNGTKIFYLNEERRNALIRVISICRNVWGSKILSGAEYRAFIGHPVKQIYIYDDNRGIRSEGKKISDKEPISYLQIHLTNL